MRKIFTLSVLFLVSAGFVHAATPVQSVQQQIAALQALLNATPDPSVFVRNLSVGSSGSDVIALQNFLLGDGYSIPAGATGYFGEQTRSALARYQKNSGIVPAAGFFGPLTRASLGYSAPSTAGTVGSGW